MQETFIFHDSVIVLLFPIKAKSFSDVCVLMWYWAEI